LNNKNTDGKFTPAADHSRIQDKLLTSISADGACGMGKTHKIKDLADLVGAELHGDPEIEGSAFASFESAGPGEIAFLARPDKKKLSESGADVLIVPEYCPDLPAAQLVVKNVNYAAAVIHNHLVSRPFVAAGIHPTAIIGSGCAIDAQVSIAAGVVIGERVTIGPGVSIGANSVIGDDCVIADDTVLYPNVTVYSRVEIGARVIIHSGVVLGADGFGFVTDDSGNHLKKPHVGRVIIEDEVELGANSCVDRANLGVTRVRRGVKTDNFVHIGHNADVGENCLLVAQVAIGGSSSLGRNCVLAGQVGVKDHVRVGDRVMAGGKTGIHRDQEDGAVISGMPAIAHRQWLKAQKVFARLPELAREVRVLTERINKYEKNISKDGGD